MTYDLKIEENPSCKRISQYILNFCFSFDHFNSIHCEKYQNLLKQQCTMEKRLEKKRESDFEKISFYSYL